MNKITFIIIGILLASFVVLKLIRRTNTPDQTAQATFIIGTNSEYPPFSFIKDGVLCGIDIELMQLVAEKLGRTIEWKDMPFDALIPALQLGTIHGIAAGLTATKERSEQAFFTTPHIKFDPLIVISRATSPVTSLNDLTGKNVVVNEGFTADYYISAMKGPHVIRLATITDAFLALQAKRVDAFVTARSAAQPFLKQADSNAYTIFTIPAVSDSYSLAVSKRYPAIYQEIEQAIEQLEADGSLQALREKWGF